MTKFAFVSLIFLVISCKDITESPFAAPIPAQSGWHLDSIYGPWADRTFYKINECIFNFDTINKILSVSAKTIDIDSGIYNYDIRQNVLYLKGLKHHENFNISFSSSSQMRLIYVDQRIADYEYYYYFTKH